MTAGIPARHGWVSLLAWACATVALVWGLLWIVSGWAYPVDVLVSFQSVAVVFAGIVLAGCLMLRRWGAVGVCLLAVMVGGWPLVEGRALRVGPVDVLNPPAPGVVRVVSFNVGPQSLVWEEDMRRVLSWHADAVVLLETPPTLWRLLRRGALQDEGWVFANRAWVDGFASPCFVLGRSGVERVQVPGVEHAERDILLTRVGVGGGVGEMLVLAVHPHSPRTRGRWEQGNEMMARTLEGALPEAERLGLPLVMAADLNAGPAAWRSRAVRRAGLRMSKPLTGGWGTFESSWPGPARIQIDDVWVGPGVRVVGWSSFQPIGSDHRVVVADLVIQRP